MGFNSGFKGLMVSQCSRHLSVLFTDTNSVSEVDSFNGVSVLSTFYIIGLQALCTQMGGVTLMSSLWLTSKLWRIYNARASFKQYSAILLLNALRTWTVLSVTDRKLCFRFRITSLVHGISLWSQYSLMTVAGTLLTEQISQCVIPLIINSNLTTLHTRAGYHYLCIVRNGYSVPYGINWFVTQILLQKFNEIK